MAYQPRVRMVRPPQQLGVQQPRQVGTQREVDQPQTVAEIMGKMREDVNTEIGSPNNSQVASQNLSRIIEDACMTSTRIIQGDRQSGDYRMNHIEDSRRGILSLSDALEQIGSQFRNCELDSRCGAAMKVYMESAMEDVQGYYSQNAMLTTMAQNTFDRYTQTQRVEEIAFDMREGFGMVQPLDSGIYAPQAVRERMARSDFGQQIQDRIAESHQMLMRSYVGGQVQSQNLVGDMMTQRAAQGMSQGSQAVHLSQAQVRVRQVPNYLVGGENNLLDPNPNYVADYVPLADGIGPNSSGYESVPIGATHVSFVSPDGRALENPDTPEMLIERMMGRLSFIDANVPNNVDLMLNKNVEINNTLVGLRQMMDTGQFPQERMGLCMDSVAGILQSSMQEQKLPLTRGTCNQLVEMLSRVHPDAMSNQPMRSSFMTPRQSIAQQISMSVAVQNQWDSVGYHPQLSGNRPMRRLEAQPQPFLQSVGRDYTMSNSGMSM